jgi:two-component sensor histidine kinase
VNELVTNALKYAFPNETKGTVTVTLKRVPGELRLTVADDSKGIDIRRADSGLGGRLVKGFIPYAPGGRTRLGEERHFQQLGGQVERESGSQGTTVRVILPSPEGSWGIGAHQGCEPHASLRYRQLLALRVHSRW